jgi:hypothetical protein
MTLFVLVAMGSLIVWLLLREIKPSTPRIRRLADIHFYAQPIETGCDRMHDLVG